MLRFIFISFVYSFLYTPILILIVNSFNQSRLGFHWAGFTLDWYRQLFTNSDLLTAVIHSLTLATLSASLATLVGTLAAVALFRYRFKGKSFVNGLLFVVMMSPDIVMAISLLALFILLGIHLGFWSLLISHITFCLPFVVITVYSRLKGFDTRLFEAAKDLGASELTTFSKVIFPIAKPAVISGWVISFSLSLDDVIISSFVTSPNYTILPLKIYAMVKLGISPEINAISSLMLVFSLLLVCISHVVMKKDDYKNE